MAHDEETTTRDRIVATAMELFVLQGYGATGIAQILAASGAHAGSLYHFFPTKEDLLLATLEERKRLLRPELLDPIWARYSDPIERVFGLLDGYRQMLQMTGFRHGCPIGNLALELTESHPQVRRVLAELFDLWAEAVADCFAKAQGRLPADRSPADLARFVLVTMEGAVMLARTHRTLDPYDNAVSQLRDYVERLLADGSEWHRPKTSPTPTPTPTTTTTKEEKRNEARPDRDPGSRRRQRARRDPEAPVRVVRGARRRRRAGQK